MIKKLQTHYKATEHR